ncbi:hypothetical protein [Haloechinothrix sp. LS1_15]|uniref:hypothetical protein n=1 Tax=Haloechinothrix sp. LS1_15 TaxID=2652248 RepID=UPI00294594D7|nr:hypothetical protein [Haloechinothrix sp. LS1_15]MDV6014235.1 hypothetical protein [Haloechinothrix sp. LS1_15]
MHNVSSAPAGVDLDSPRARAILRAVACGHGELTSSMVPDLFIDGLACCDQFTAHALALEGFIRPEGEATSGQRVPARLSMAGWEALERGPREPGGNAPNGGVVA